MVFEVAVLTTLVVGYLIGSIPVANLVAARTAGRDLRTVGDRNPGFWNAKEQVGRRAARWVFVGDVAKGALAAGVGVALADGRWWLPYLGGLAAMIGHAWPLFAGFRGGRSVLTWVGAVAVYAPVPTAIAVGVLAAVWAFTRRFDVAARAGVVALPFVQIAIEGAERTALTGVLMTLIGFRFAQAAWSHRA